MAPPLFVAGSALLRLYSTVAGQLVINTYGLRVTGNPTFDQTLANAIGSAIKSNWGTNLGGAMHTTTSLLRVGIRDYRTANQPEYRDTGAAQSGISAGDPLPPQVALCITIRTALTGKSFRGRTYIAGWSEAANDATGKCSSATASGATAFLAAMNTSLQGQGFKLAVLSRPAERSTLVRTTFHNDGTTTTDTLSTTKQKDGAITDATIFESRNLNWETQRSRANGRGLPPTALDAVITHSAVALN